METLARYRAAANTEIDEAQITSYQEAFVGRMTLHCVTGAIELEAAFPVLGADDETPVARDGWFHALQLLEMATTRGARAAALRAR